MLLSALLFVGAVLLIATVIPMVHSSLLENKLNYLETLKKQDFQTEETE